MEIAKETNVFNFSVRVWLTSVVVAPVLQVLVVSHGKLEGKLPGAAFFWFYAMVCGFLLSLPSAVIFYLLTKTINRQPWVLSFKKMTLVVVGFILSVAPFYVLAWINTKQSLFNFSFKVMLPYIVTIIAGILIYRLKPKKQIDVNLSVTDKA